MFISMFASLILSVNWISKLELLKDILVVFHIAEQGVEMLSQFLHTVQVPTST